MIIIPLYFSLILSILTENIKPNLVKNLYKTIMDFGFQFKDGYMEAAGNSLRQITKMTQKKLPYHEKWLELLNLQILFNSDMFSEVRGSWNQLSTEVQFVLLIKNADILCKPDGREFLADKLESIKKLAVDIWEKNQIEAVQTNIADDNSSFNLTSINKGQDVLFCPFAIICKNVYSHFLDYYFSNCTISEVNNNGIFICNKSKLNKSNLVHKNESLLSKEFFAEQLVAVFPEFLSIYKEHIKDYGELLGHIFFADVINLPLTELLRKNTEKAKIKLYIELMEDMYKNGEEAVKNIIEVSVLEYLGDETIVLRNAYTYFSPELIEASRKVERSWGRI